MSREVEVQSNILYIEPVTACNLHCKLCYTTYDSRSNLRYIPSKTIQTAISKLSLDYILWCGRGEVFLYPQFAKLVNTISKDYPHISHIIQTNGQIIALENFTSPDKIEIRISIDGLQEAHDANRGTGTYTKALAFARHYYNLGHKIRIRALINCLNLTNLSEFKTEMLKEIGPNIYVNAMLPMDNEVLKNYKAEYAENTSKQIDNKLLVPRTEALEYLSKLDKDFVKDILGYNLNSELPPLYVYPALFFEGLFTCCEGMKRIGTVSDVVKHLPELGKLCSDCSFKSNCFTALI